MMRWGVLFALLAALPIAGMSDTEALVQPPWAQRLEARLETLEDAFEGELGVHVRVLGSDERFGFRDDERWYLASLIKVPVAIELMSRVERGEASLATSLTLAESDYVDGAGPTNWASPGTSLRLEELLEPMLTVSDNTATDMLIRHLGLEAVNRRAALLAGVGFGPITTLVDVRRHVYSWITPEAFALTGMQALELRKLESGERLEWLARHFDIRRDALPLPSLDDAYTAYYASGLNAGRLDAYANLLAALGEGRALGPRATAELLSIMQATTSGENRLKAGIGPEPRFAHKTGTQHRRACDAGIVLPEAAAQGQRIVVVACTRGPLETTLHERALAAIGVALRDSGALASGGISAP
ncbi:serine hydrolase [Halomonas urumqiensis]|uniref:Serine hydrolase n=1 Tax=Halomonas urumqiensis TaxID=1684789 RepID=A0A2N7UQS7_9GAMM|nr:serine hydrolase [Halomonas urumqiensis]PMR82797.1 serine hydrolase [Halomonas urumqiensis]PTB01884.1 serine hydrolase [Halomonas urumqiensis]GHE21989.1 hypothetical protein GCM10017767_25100 [Halomonas urumqiensis]